jgi:hypothetical protein
VVRFSRVGQELPFYFTRMTDFNVEFNSSFEEFGLLMQLRRESSRAPRCHIFTKKPLAICLPPEKLQPWQTGRVESKLAAKLA